jgi:hypothetical protein
VSGPGQSLRATALLGALTLLLLAGCSQAPPPGAAARTVAAERSPVGPTSTAAPALTGTAAPASAGSPAPSAPAAAKGEAATGRPSLVAVPNPVPPGQDNVGTTTVSWSTGRPSGGEVWVSEDGGPERLFASRVEGSQAAPWIRAGATYEFRLYAGSDRATRLATVQVRRAS